ncbi:hypothetical protein NSPZN2_30445 [Nitrospira defluvii]|uniref:Uncharacterized protein n=1 Tax=Nitrospira defluvii TaxID=330214 RepID=A0ABN7LL79_9BACT|nr:hypothetical protein NSPZN2_30445 [Nitrospira defluvii]
MPLQSPCKFLNLGAADWSLPALGLNLDHIEAQSVFINDSVNAFVTTATDGPPRFFTAPSIAHFYEYIDDQTLEERRGTFLCGLQQL